MSEGRRGGDFPRQLVATPQGIPNLAVFAHEPAGIMFDPRLEVAPFARPRLYREPAQIRFKASRTIIEGLRA